MAAAATRPDPKAETNGQAPAQPVAKAKPDAELRVMSRITRILADLEPGARKRVVAYFHSRETATAGQ